MQGREDTEQLKAIQQKLHAALERNAQLQGRNAVLVEDLHTTQRLLEQAERRLRERAA